MKFNWGSLFQRIIVLTSFISISLSTVYGEPFMGDLRLLLIRCGNWLEPTDECILSYFSDSAVNEALVGANAFFKENSWNKVGVAQIDSGSALTAGVCHVGSEVGWYEHMYEQGIVLAQSEGYDTANFDAVCILWNCPGDTNNGAEGAQAPGPNLMFFYKFWGADVLIHELRHVLLMKAENPGSWEACYWQAPNSIDAPPTGTRIPYGDELDMGGYQAYPSDRSINACAKNGLGWTSKVYDMNNTYDGNMQTISIAAIDGPSDNDWYDRAIKVRRNVIKTDRTDLDQEYWIELREKFTDVKSINNGAVLHWAPCSYSGDATLLLDMSPQYKGNYDWYDRKDVGLYLGKTLLDTAACVYITPINMSNTSPKSMEVVVSTGYFADNNAPSANISCENTSVYKNQSIAFWANGDDPDHDALAFYWDFGDSSDETSNTTSISHVYTKAGQYTVSVTVSDMKGKTAVSTVAIQVYESIPESPDNLVATTLSGSRIALSWNDNSDNESGFYIERATGLNGPWNQIASVGADITSFEDVGLMPNTTYRYRVRAYNATGNSNYSNISSATTLAGISAPAYLGAAIASPTSITLWWNDNSSNETGFEIEIATSSSGPWTLLATTAANITHFTTGTLSPTTTYWFRVRAFNNLMDYSSYSNTASARTQDVPPSAPSSMIATAVSGSQINLSWTDNSNNETGFYLERSIGSSNSWNQIAMLGANVTSYSSTGLQAGTTYNYRIRAYNNLGISTYSDIATATTFANLALSGTVSASSVQQGNSAGNAKDNNTGTRWAASSGTMPQWWKVDLGSSRHISGFEIMFERRGNSGDCNDFTIETSDDDVYWTTQVDRSTNTNTAQTQAYSFDGTARYVRISISDAPGYYYASMYEFRVFGQ